MSDKKIISTKKPRIAEIDILKALAIICMVMGHSDSPITHFIYLFHMAVFFIASGFFYKEKTADNISSVFSSIKGKFKRLWIPFFVWNTIYVLLHNVFIQINVYTDNPDLMNYVAGDYIKTTDPYTIIQMFKQIIKGALFTTDEQIFGAGWFLKILFMVSVLYLIVDFLARKIFKSRIILVQAIVSALLLLLGYICFLLNIKSYGLAQAASYYWLYFIGHLLALYKDKYMLWKLHKFVLSAAGSLCVLLLLNNFGSISLVKNSYENPLFFILTSISGWVFLYSLSHFICFIPFVKRIMTEISKSTLSIMILHFLAMKIVALAVTAVYQMPLFCVAAFPNLMGNVGAWWLAYTVVGVCVPVLLNMAFRFCTGKVKVVFAKSKKKQQRN